MSKSILFCLCGPSGSGKSSIATKLIAEVPNLSLSISTTTRQPRPGETEGVHYYFVSEKQFQQRIDAGLFIEHAIYNNHRYGTATSTIARMREEGKDVLLDIDVQGVAKLKLLYPKHCVTIMVVPPSKAELKKRIQERMTDSEAAIAERLALASTELKILTQADFSDYLVRNVNLAQAVIDARAIIQAERLKFSRLADEEVAEIL